MLGLRCGCKWPCARPVWYSQPLIRFQVVNTVNFSNHSGLWKSIHPRSRVLSDCAGYRRFGGSRANAAELNQLFDLMEKNKLLQPERVLTGKHDLSRFTPMCWHFPTGYIPGGEALSAVLELARKLRERNPTLLYLLDRRLSCDMMSVLPLRRTLVPKRFSEIQENYTSPQMWYRFIARCFHYLQSLPRTGLK